MKKLLSLGVLVSLVGCGVQRGGAEVQVGDSAGIKVVTNMQFQEPVLLGMDTSTLITDFGAGGKGTPFGSISGGILLRDGRVVVVDFMARSVIGLSPGGGRYVYARRGGGPGELRFPVNIARLANDSFQIYDRRMGRLLVFDPDGAFAHDISISNDGGPPPLAVYRFDDELLAGLVRNRAGRVLLERKGEYELTRTPFRVVIYDLDGAALDTIITLPGPEEIQGPGVSMMPAYGIEIPFAASAWSGRTAYGPGGDPEFYLAGKDGTIQEIVRFAVERVGVDRDALVRLLRTESRGFRGSPSLDRLPMLFPEFLPKWEPVYQSIFLDDRERIWLGSDEPFRSSSRVWFVFERTGELSRAYELPASIRVLDVHGDRWAVVRTDSLGIQTVEVHRLPYEEP